ncbi:hypothetical protein GQ43DRAFT_443736 [Delitschia confertaspora ATCC 74209]|uniref:Integral membrane protein n=1 Tax=Delitschia confertaspora ATCC 74209 TaxID=1513339 RepID=A0A9P4JEP7_9PLEO|nr:hypothetical protein GQ43DRAFT_443736 [Delitschia confertaspora ATCC 74209]
MMKALFILPLVLGIALAESVIDYTKLPDCAHQCTVLQQAEANCVPPAAPVTEQAIYQSCLCQSGLLTSLYSSGALCQPFCPSAEDTNKISQYYTGLCKGPVVTPGAAAKPADTTSTSTAGTNTATAGAANGGTASKQKNDWFDTHWKWVVMVIIIGVAIIFFWVGGFFLRRHFHRKNEAKRANMAAVDAYVASSGPDTPASKKTTTTDGSIPSPMASYNGRPNYTSRNMAMDGGIGGIAPPRQRLRSRTNTLQSLTGGNGSRNSLPQPVVWGPHQHQAHTAQNGSPGSSIPPSPTSAIIPPNAVFRNRDASGSSQRFVQYKATPTGITVEPIYPRETSNTSFNANTSPVSPIGGEIPRPSTAGENRRVAGVRGAPALTGYNSDPQLRSRQSQGPGFFDAGTPNGASTPQKLRKQQE